MIIANKFHLTNRIHRLVVTHRVGEKKGGNKLKVCVDYRDLNARTLKDHFPLSFLFTIVNEIVGKKLYSFMDRYSRYNQVSIAFKDCHKTTFTSPWGTFVML
jgi:hypothetical protein